jgi:hypothetical protein
MKANFKKKILNKFNITFILLAFHMREQKNLRKLIWRYFQNGRGVEKNKAPTGKRSRNEAPFGKRSQFRD